MPTSQSGRVLVGCFWFFSIVTLATYTGNLIAFLAVNTVKLPFNDLTEMVQQNQIKWGQYEGTGMVEVFRVSMKMRVEFATAGVPHNLVITCN